MTPFLSSRCRSQTSLLACWLVLLVLVTSFSASVRAAEVSTIPFDLPAAYADQSLKIFSAQAGLEVLFRSDITKGVRTNAVKGDLTPREALTALLSGTGLVAVQDEQTGVFSVRKETAEEKNGERLAQRTSDQPKSTRVGDSDEPAAVVKLSVFEVVDSSYSGYVATKTLSGSKVAMDVFSMPQTINIVTRDLLDDTGAFDPGTAMTKTVPGVINYFNPAPALGMMIRGFRAQNWAVDGATIRNLGMVSNFNNEALEVIKGPTALLFGPFGAYGGYVNMVPKTPSRTPVHKFEASLGGDSFYSAMLDYGDVFGAKDNYQYRLVMGMLDNQRPGYADDYNRGWTVAPSFAIDISETTRLKVRVEQSHMEQRWSRGALNAQGEWVKGFSANGPIAGNRSKTDNFTAQLVLTSQFSDYWAFKFNFLQQLEDHEFGLGVLNGALPAADYQYSLTKRQMEQKTFYTDFSTTWTLPDIGESMSNQLLVGANLNYYDNPWFFSATSTQYAEYSGIRINPENPNWDPVRAINLDYATLVIPYNREWLGGVIAQNTFTAFDGKLKLLLGARYNYDERTNHTQTRASRTAPLVGNPAPLVVNRKTTFRYGAVYELTENTAVYYGHDEAYLPVGAVFRVDGSKLDPEQGKNDEIGAKVNLFRAFGGYFSGSIAYFNLEVSNKYRADPANPGFVISDGVQENHGVDAQLQYASDKFSGLIGVYNADGPVEKQPNTGLRAVLTPKVTYNFWGKYNITKNLAIGGGYHWVGSSLSSDRRLRTDAFGSADLFATYTMKAGKGALHYRLGISNLFDEEAVTIISSAAQVITEDARNIKATVSYSW